MGLLRRGRGGVEGGGWGGLLGWVSVGWERMGGVRELNGVA